LLYPMHSIFDIEIKFLLMLGEYRVSYKTNFPPQGSLRM
jgi:hypothetical protein